MPLNPDEINRINRSTLGNKIYLIDNEYIYANLEANKRGVNPESLFESLIGYLDLTYYFPAFYSMLAIVILFLDIPQKFLAFFTGTLLLYIYGLYKSYTKTNVIDGILNTVYYIFAKFHILVFIVAIIFLLIFKFYIAIPIFVGAKLLGFLFGLFTSNLTTKVYKKKYGVSLMNADFFILNNFDLFKAKPKLGFQGNLNKYIQYLNESNNQNSDDVE